MLKSKASPRYIPDAATAKKIAAELRHPSRAQRRNADRKTLWDTIHDGIEDALRPTRRLLLYISVDTDRITDVNERLATPADLAGLGRA